MQQQPWIPEGFKFQPTDRQLVGFFLLNRVFNGASTNPPVIYEWDLYGDQEPWEVWAMLRPIYEGMFKGADALDGNHGLYFFTKLKKKDPAHKRVARGVGSNGGTWHGLDAEKKICEQRGVAIGALKKFGYKNTKSVHHGKWMLHEYTLSGGGNVQDSDEVVLCRLRRKREVAVPVVVGDHIQ